MISFARNPSELVYRQPLLTRLVGAVAGVALLAFILAMWPQLLAQELPMPAMLACEALGLAGIAVCIWMVLSLRIAFVFGTDGIVSREWWGTRSLAYSAMAGCTVEPEEQANRRGPAVRGYSMTFEAMRPGIKPLRLFVAEGLPLDSAIVRRLRTVPGISSRQLKVLELAASGRLTAG